MKVGTSIRRGVSLPMLCACLGLFATSRAAADPGYAFAATDSGLFRRGIGDSSWAYVPFDTVRPLTAVARHERDVIAADKKGHVFHSSDGGIHWIKVDLPFSGYDRAKLMNVDSLFFWYDGRLLVSKDYGEKWTELPAPVGGVNTMAYMGNFLVEPDFSLISENWIYLSSDMGAHWGSLPVRDFKESFSLAPPLLGVGSELWVGGYYGISSWSPQGKFLKPSGLAGFQINTLVRHGDYVFAGTGKGLFRTKDKGASWSQSDSGMSGADIRVLTFNREAGYALTGTGQVFRSIDTGGSWSAADEGLPGKGVNALDAGEPGPEEPFHGFDELHDTVTSIRDFCPLKPIAAKLNPDILLGARDLAVGCEATAAFAISALASVPVSFLQGDAL